MFSWDYFLQIVGLNKGTECVQAPRRDNVYNEPSVSFYKDGTVWVSGAKGCVQLFRSCPYRLMEQIYRQRKIEASAFFAHSEKENK